MRVHDEFVVVYEGNKTLPIIEVVYQFARPREFHREPRRKQESFTEKTSLCVPLCLRTEVLQHTGVTPLLAPCFLRGGTLCNAFFPK